MTKEPKNVRLPVMVTESELAAIDEWRFQNRIATRAEALRRLIQRGLSPTVEPDRPPVAEVPPPASPRPVARW